MDKFILYKSVPNVFTFTIKQQGSTLPMVLDDSDTFEIKLYNIATNLEVSDIEFTVTKLEPYTAGKIQIDVSGDGLAGLTPDRGDKADRYYLKPTHKLVMRCDTVNNGDFIARVDNVYVDA